KVVLTWGNFLNSGTKQGGAAGFRLSTLSKLGTVKRVNGKGTLLHFLCEWAVDKKEDFVDLEEDLEHAKFATRNPLSEFSANAAKMRLGAKLAAEHKARKEGPKPAADRFVEVMEPFLAKAEKMLEELDAKVAAAEEAFSRVKKKYGEDPKKV
ncbi:unnamed protein product, partial [Phaeothamnion confervicola]